MIEEIRSQWWIRGMDCGFSLSKHISEFFFFIQLIWNQVVLSIYFCEKCGSWWQDLIGISMNHFESGTERRNCSIQSGPYLWALLGLCSDQRVAILSFCSHWGALATLYSSVALGTKAAFLSGDLCSKINWIYILTRNHIPKSTLKKKEVIQCK